MKESTYKRITETKIKLASAICKQLNGKYTKESKGKLFYILSKIRIGNVYKLVYDYAKKHPESCDVLQALSMFTKKESIEYLLEKLKDSSALHRDLIVECLGNYKRPELIAYLKKYLADDDRQVRFQTAQALYNIGGKEAALEMCKYISDPDEWISMTILGLVCKMKVSETIPILVEKYHNDTDLRRKATMVSFLSMFNDITLLAIFDEALDSREARLRANAIEAIGDLRLPEEELFKRVSPFLNDPNNRIRANAILAIAKLAPNKVKQQIIEMCNSDDVQLRRSAAWVLGIIPPTDYYKEAEKLVVDENETVRKRMIQSLKNFPHEFISANIRKVLSDKNKWIRKYAVDMVASIPAFEATPIVEILKKEKSGPNIEACLKFLVSHPSDNAMDSLKVHFKDQRIPVIKSLLKALLAVSGVAGVKKVAPLLDQHDPFVVQNIATTLFETGDLATLDNLLGRFVNVKSQSLLDMLIPTMEAIVDIVIKDDKMPPKLLKAFSVAPITVPTEQKTDKAVQPNETAQSTQTSQKIQQAVSNTQVTKTSEKTATNKQLSTDSQGTSTDYKVNFDFKVSNEPQEEIIEEKTDFVIPSFEGLDLASIDDGEDNVKKKINASHYKAGLKAYNLGKYTKAMDEFNQSINSGEEAPIMIDVYIGMILYSQNNVDSAITHLKSYLEKNPTNSKVTFLLGKYYKKNKDWQNLINTYQLFIQGDLDADSSPKMRNRIYQDMGTACAILGKNETAIRLLNILSRLESDNAEICYYLAMALYKMKRTSEAAVTLDKAKKIPNKSKSLEKQIADLAQTVRSGAPLY